jgi:hypothetical protein
MESGEREKGGLLLWDLYKEDENPRMLEGAGGEIQSVRFSQDNQWVVADVGYRETALWDLKTGDQHIQAVFRSRQSGGPASKRNPAKDRAFKSREPKSVFLPCPPDSPRCSTEKQLRSHNGRWIIANPDGWVLLHPGGTSQLLEEARTAGVRSLTPEEWADFFTGQPYRATIIDPGNRCQSSPRN